MTDYVASPNSVPPELVDPPLVPSYVPARKTPLLPLLFGFLIVITIAAAMGIAYYKTKLTATASPSPTASALALASADPSIEPTATPSGSPKSSLKPSVKPSAKSTSTPKPTTTTQSSPTPTPISQPTLDIRFGNPSAHVKQTIDEGLGDGRVINREYSSIQAGQFDEVSSTWSPRATVCFHLVADEAVSGKDIKFSMSLDDKIEVEDTMSWIDKLEAGRLYDWCHDVTTNIGKHTAKLLLNPSKSIKELNSINNIARLDWENLPDKIAPNFTLVGPNDEGASGTCLFPQYITDNVTSYANLKIEQKVDGADWTKFDGNRYCFTGTSGSAHSYISRITDERGNVNEQTKTFVLY